MNNIEEVSRVLRDRISELLVPLQTRKVIDGAAFEGVAECTRQLARQLKGSELVPKTVLNEIRVTIGVLRAEAPYAGDKTPDLISMANRLEMVFDLILRGETSDDRVPGVPRII